MTDPLMLNDCTRVGRDPIRKLEPDERLIGLLVFLRRMLGSDVTERDGYKLLASMTNIAIDIAGITPQELDSVNGWDDIIWNDDFADKYRGVLEDIFNDWERNFTQ